MRFAFLVGVLVVALVACKKKEEPPPAAPPPAPVAAPEPAPTPAPAPATATGAPEDATAASANPLQNGWNLPPRGTTAKEGDRVFVLTQGKNRSYLDTQAIYHLFAHEMGPVKGEVMTIRELGGGEFQVTGLFVVPAGVAKLDDLKVGDMVLAEWASSLKHAVVTKLEAPDKVHVRYTDLPDTWGDDKITAVKALREVTKQQEGLQPGNWAIAKQDDRQVQVLLVQDAQDRWLAKQFNGRVAVFAKTDLTPLPLQPKLKAGQPVLVPWVGMYYPGKVKKVTGARVEVLAEGIASKEPVVTSLGQVLPVEAKPAK